MDRRYVNLILILIILAAAVWVDLPRAEGSPGLTIGNFHRTLNPVLGLDLRGGLQVLLAPQAGVTVDAQALADTSKILENRANGLGVNEVVFQVAGDKYILAEFPGLTNTNEVIASIKQTGLLEFIDAGTTQLAPGTIVVTDYGQNSNSGADATATPGATSTPAATTTPEASATPTAAPETIYHTVMTGADIKSAVVEAGQTLGGFAVGFELNPEGAAIFNTHTSQNVGKYLAIVLDKRVISCPVIDSAIPDGQGQISGSFTSEEANNLAVTLRYGGLKVPVEVVESKVVGPTLGSDSLSKSLTAGIIGFAIVFLFMLIYYRLPGAMAVISISIYAAVVFALYKLIPVTLTLPGIAGFLLSTGGALDANILIFERMKEELRNGRNLRQAVELGWTRAWPSIRDSNIATLITSIILFWFGSTFGASIVQGFALTLMLGVVISVLAAVFITRTFLRISVEFINPASHEKWFGA
ncbi:MAG TPA: protein translocase subunit SecD [Anaerolineaceae bacterium]|jgi:preprotein translocase subunit SecD|nr:protein translocase subunit SecD [Anaerolineaceae bacterium]